MNWIIQNTKGRAIVSGLLTTAVSISLAVLDDWSKDQSLYFVKVVVFILFSLLDLMYITFCAAQDSKEKSLLAELQRQINAYQNSLAGIIEISHTNALSINTCIHDFDVNKKINEKLWNYKMACYQLCRVIYIAVCKLTLANNKDCEIVYVRLNEHTDGEISTFAYENKAHQAPKLLDEKRNFKADKTVKYFDMQLFAEDNKETTVLYGSEEINNHFYRTPIERTNHPQKYNQFIAIPVICDETKIVGLLEIACLNNCSLGEDEKIVKEIAEQHFIPYANLFLLLHKLDKALHLGL